jgi:hypothetical protein
MSATNHRGWQVESFDRKQGWRRASKVFKHQISAEIAMDNWTVKGVELRVMPALEPAPITPAQWLGELGKRVKRFYRINQG